jgi:hypothetical protein
MMRICLQPTSRRCVFTLALASFSLVATAASPLWAKSAAPTLASAAEAQLMAAPGTDETAPSEGGIAPPAATDRANPSTAAPDDSGAIADPARPNIDPNAPLPDVLYDLSKLPEPVRKMHDALVTACKSGDVEKLRPLLSTGSEATQLTFGEMSEDPIRFLHDQAGDQGGQEILAIMEEILDAGYVHLDAGKPQELYVWPYFFAIPLDKLNAPQRVELFRIITAGDYQDMKSIGAYVFYRLGITPQGKWAFFLAGD